VWSQRAAQLPIDVAPCSTVSGSVRSVALVFAKLTLVQGSEADLMEEIPVPRLASSSPSSRGQAPAPTSRARSSGAALRHVSRQRRGDEVVAPQPFTVRWHAWMSQERARLGKGQPAAKAIEL
jgi:hypothetical protein